MQEFSRVRAHGEGARADPDSSARAPVGAAGEGREDGGRAAGERRYRRSFSPIMISLPMRLPTSPYFSLPKFFSSGANM